MLPPYVPVDRGFRQGGQMAVRHGQVKSGATTGATCTARPFGATPASLTSGRSEREGIHVPHDDLHGRCLVSAREDCRVDPMKMKDKITMSSKRRSHRTKR